MSSTTREATSATTRKMAAPRNTPTTADSAARAASAKMHRRSRSGCFTCRLRRKKCEEGKPYCKACKHLGLKCDYKRPMWWSNTEQRRQRKETIKNAIKQTQFTKKSAAHQHQQQHMPLGSTTPPGLCHSAPSTADIYSHSTPPTGPPSIDSPFDFAHMSPDGYFQIPPHPQVTPEGPFPTFSPYEIDVKTERQIFINDMPHRKDSTISTFSTFQPPPPAHGQPGLPVDSWVTQEYFESNCETFADEPIDFDFFEYPHGPITPEHEMVIQVEECDQYLLNHFLDKVLKLIFPVLDANQHGSARSDVILPALESNRAYLHCCLSVAAMHMKSTERMQSEQIDNDIVRHRYAAISELCEALNQDTKHERILEATLGMMFFQCSVGRPDDGLPDIPWHQHFKAATDLVYKLDLPSYTQIATLNHGRPPFNMTLTSWIDILGATLTGTQPVFADLYRNLNTQHGGIGLAELMGCDDRIMFLISEIACLDVQNREGLNEDILCKYVELLASEIGATEAGAGTIQSCFSTTGAIRPKQLTTNMSAVFRAAARVYLTALVPGNEPRQPAMQHCVGQFTELMNFIPAGPEGFDRSLAWPLLIAGANSAPNSTFRAMFAQRCARLGDAAEVGSFGRIRELLRDTWLVNDARMASIEFRQGVHWRDVMRQKGWDFLLI